MEKNSYKNMENGSEIELNCGNDYIIIINEWNEWNLDYLFHSLQNMILDDMICLSYHNGILKIEKITNKILYAKIKIFILAYINLCIDDYYE